MFQMESAPNARTIINGREMDYFCGTGYFGLQGHPALIKAASEATEKYGIGSATSRAGYGNNPVILDVEKKAAEFFGTESALYYVSGYLGNAILLQGLSPEYDVIFADSESHYSVFDGAAIARKPVVTFAHCNPDDLKEKLHSELKPSQIPLVISDGVFPTSGVIAPLHQYDEILSHYDQSILCVDDAHATGVMGDKGHGTLEYCQVEGERRYASGTLSKALGGHGGIITGTTAFIELLKQHSHIPYSTSSTPIPAAAASVKALEILRLQPALRQQLWDNVAYAKNAFHRIGFNDIPDTPVPIICLSPKGADLPKLQQRLYEQGMVVHYVPGGSYTSVPKAGAIRIAIFSSHTSAQIDSLVTTIGGL